MQNTHGYTGSRGNNNSWFEPAVRVDRTINVGSHNGSYRPTNQRSYRQHQANNHSPSFFNAPSINFSYYVPDFSSWSMPTFNSWCPTRLNPWAPVALNINMTGSATGISLAITGLALLILGVVVNSVPLVFTGAVMATIGIVSAVITDGRRDRYYY